MVEGALKEWDAALLSGAIDRVTRVEQWSSIYNASVLLQPAGQVPQMYRKMHLVPFAERVPFLDYIPWLGYATMSLSGISGWDKGTEHVIMRLKTPQGTVRIANIICYESIFPEHVARFVGRGAELLTIVTNDGWYGTSYGPYQHLAIGRFRAIENRRAVARCANTGVTAFIDRYGRIMAEVPWWQEATLTADVPLERDLTFYTQYPDLLPQGALAASCLFIAMALVRRKRFDEA
jgi:apolipoprotein N-acyltransferase